MRWSGVQYFRVGPDVSQKPYMLQASFFSPRTNEGGGADPDMSHEPRTRDDVSRHPARPLPWIYQYAVPGHCWRVRRFYQSPTVGYAYLCRAGPGHGIQIQCWGIDRTILFANTRLALDMYIRVS